MVPEPSHTTLGMEYFCNRDEPFWSMDDEKLIAMAARELEQIGLVSRDLLIDGCVHRVPNAYPVYDASYAKHLKTLREYCDQFDNLRTIGRNGLHRYNNQDHSMLTGMLAVRMLHLGEQHDLWQINAEQEYLEEDWHTGKPIEAYEA